MSVIGRREVIGHLTDLLDEPGGRAVLVGEPGLGKSTVLEAVRRSLPGGVRVAAIHVVEVEAHVGLATAELLSGALLALRPVVDPETLAVVRALAEPGLEGLAYDERALSVALGRLLVAVAAADPLVLVVDDLHWMDPQSAAVIHGALRRAGDADVRVLAATRGVMPLPLPGAVTLVLPPLTETAVREIVDLHLGRRLGPELGRPLAAAVGGNPMFALELARALPADATAADVRLSGTLSETVNQRVGTLPLTCRSALVDIAVRGHCTWDDLADDDALAPALAEDVIRDDGRSLGFAHPLYARAILDAATPHELVRAHARAAERAADPLERARHLAATSPTPDESMAALLEDASVRLHARGDLVSAEAVARASSIATPSSTPASVRWRRLHGLAQVQKALDSLSVEVVDQLGDLAGSSDEVALTGLVASRDIEQRRAMLREVVADPTLSVRVRLLLANELLAAELFLGDHVTGLELVSPLVPVEPPVDAELEWAELVGGVALMSRLLARPIDRTALEHAVAVVGADAASSRIVTESPSTMLGLIAMYDDDLATAADLLAGPAEQRPDSPSGEAFHALELWCRTGEIRRARSFVETGVGWFVDDAFAFVYTLLSAWEGDAGRCRRDAALALDLAARTGDVMYPQGVATALALLELGRGDAERSWSHAGPASATLHARDWVEPSIFPVLPIAIEAALWSGRSLDAEERLGWLEHAAGAIPSRWATAMASRGRGLQMCLGGDADRGLGLVLASADQLGDLGLPNERARSLLVAGQLQRRLGRRTSARASLDEALALFARCGIEGFAGLCESELGRLGGRGARTTGLTETERQVASLVAAGASNPEVAAALVVSVKTVETHLSRVYRKLGVRNRTELAARWVELG